MDIIIATSFSYFRLIIVSGLCAVCTLWTACVVCQSSAKAVKAVEDNISSTTNHDYNSAEELQQFVVLLSTIHFEYAHNFIRINFCIKRNIFLNDKQDYIV